MNYEKYTYVSWRIIELMLEFWILERLGKHIVSLSW